MVLRDILKDSIDLARVPISDSDFIKNYNRIVTDLAMLYNTAKARDTKTITCTSVYVEYDLDTGCLGIERVLDSYGSNFKFYKTRCFSKIIFDYEGTYTVYELFDQAPITKMDDAISINLAYMKSIAEFIAGKAVKKTDPEYSKELIANSAVDAEIVNKNIRKVSNPSKRVYVPKFR